MSYDPDPAHYVNGSFIIWHLVSGEWRENGGPSLKSTSGMVVSYLV